jgi:hypothetical protein
VISEKFGGSQKLVFIGKDDYLVFRIVVPNGKDKRTVTDMSDYKNIKGVFVPFKIRVSVENLNTKTADVSEIKIIDFRGNVKFDDSIFTMSNIYGTPVEIPGLDIKNILNSIIDGVSK